MARVKMNIPPWLDLIVKEGQVLPQILRTELNYGDLLGVFTQNSVYAIGVLEDGHYMVSGGYFDKRDLSPVKLAINGCTWGGSAIKQDIIAAEGLCLEFGNGLTTSPIRKFHVLKFGAQYTRRYNSKSKNNGLSKSQMFFSM